jgi:NitT/TauT family transport system ATP-binding protein
MTGPDVWGFAPEKVLAARHDWIEENPILTRSLMRAIYHAARWLDDERNKPLAVEILARSEHLNLSPDVIDPALTGHLTPHANASPINVDRFLMFHDHSASFPWRSQAAWIAAQLGADPAGIERAKQCWRTDLYRQNLSTLGTNLPIASDKIEGSMNKLTTVASSRGQVILAPDAFFDGRTFDFATHRDE